MQKVVGSNPISRFRVHEHLDVLIVGAGLSGIGAALPPAEAMPGRRLTRSSRRASAIGGTWDLFRYPGIRSDSDMYTLGYSFQPVDGAARRSPTARRSCDYLRETAREYGIDRQHPLRPPRRARRRGRRPTRAGRSRSSAPAPARRVRCTCSFLFMCSGYYDYDEGYAPDFAGHGALRGPHRASAALARGPRLRRQARRRDRQRRHRGDAGAGDGRARAAHVTMLQRSPTYVVSLPADDAIAQCAAPRAAGQGSPTRSRAGRTSCSRWRSTRLCRRAAASS